VYWRIRHGEIVEPPIWVLLVQLLVSGSMSHAVAPDRSASQVDPPWRSGDRCRDSFADRV